MNKINGCNMTARYECIKPKECKFSSPKYITMNCACRYNDFGDCLNMDANNEAIKEWIEEMNCAEDDNAIKNV